MDRRCFCFTIIQNRFKVIVRVLLCLITTSIFLTSCSQSLKVPVDRSNQEIESGDKMVIEGHWNISSTVEVDQEVIIFPQAYITTTGQGRIQFNGTVTILGEGHVFAEDLNVSFKGGTISNLNPCWFGAKGHDDQDDTKAFQKTIEIANAYTRTINIHVPIGRFILKAPLEIENHVANERAINIIGEGLSGNTIYGSCLQWHGESDTTMLQIRNLSQSRIEGIEFTSYSTTSLKHNIKLLPSVNQFVFINCSFNGCQGSGSANVNLNKGNNAQVSEISFDNCIFRGLTNDNVNWLTESGVIGGLANTKNFYFRKCSFLGYTRAAIDIDISDVVNVENCTFSVNNLDISCSLCNAHIISNYSEQSKAFFANGTSMNFSFTTMMNNYFDGHLDDNYVIREGSGSLILVNNSFGGTGWSDPVNRINWRENEISSITSIGNYYRNTLQDSIPFFTSGGTNHRITYTSLNDLLGENSMMVKKLLNIIEKQE